MWDRIYFKVLRNSSFVYTFWEKEAQKDKYPDRIDSIDKTLIKKPVKFEVNLKEDNDDVVATEGTDTPS